MGVYTTPPPPQHHRHTATRKAPPAAPPLHLLWWHLLRCSGAPTPAPLHLLATMLPLLLLLIPTTMARSKHRQMTTEVAAGAEDCFFLPEVKVGQSIELEYQVTSSSVATGNNDITARLLAPAPTLTVLFESIMRNDGSFSGEAEESGDFKVCFDNKDSTWSDKILWFEINVEDPEDDYTDDDDYFDPEDWDNMVKENEDTESLFELKVEDIKTSIHAVRMKVGKMRHFQFMRGGSMSKDVHQAESNMSRLNFWSGLRLLLMLVVGVSQVYMVRQLFDDKSVVQKMTARA